MTYRDERAALSQRISDLESRLDGIRRARSHLTLLADEEAEALAELDSLRRRSALTSDEIRYRLPMLQRIEIASPCKVSWDSMKGDAKVRFCGACEMNVYNLSAMDTAEAELFLGARSGRTCVRLFRRDDGTVMTRDCPVALKRRNRRRLAAAIVVSAGVATALMASLVSWRQSREIDPKPCVQVAPAQHSPTLEMGDVAPARPAAFQGQMSYQQ